MLKIGKFVNTHGIKGEIRIKSDFSRKDLIFKKLLSAYFFTFIKLEIIFK